MTPRPDFALLGFSDPTPRFVRVLASEDATGQIRVDGVGAIPGLPVCRVQIAGNGERFDRFGPSRQALQGYVRAALHEEIAAELPWN